MDDLNETEEMDDLEDTKTMNGKTVLNFTPRPKLKLSEVEHLIRKHRIIVPCPARQTLIGMCEDGTFESVGRDSKGFPAATSLGWLVFEDSFLKWARAMDGAAVAA